MNQMTNPFDVLNENIKSLQAQVSQLHALLNNGISNNQIDRSQLATRQTAAKYLGVSLSTVDNLLKSKQLKPTKIGGSIRFRWQDLDAFIEKRVK